VFIGYVRTIVHIPYSLSLKDKRRVANRIKQRARNTFNVSVSEKPSDKWQICELSFVCVNYTRRHTQEVVDKLERFVGLFSDLQIIEIEKEVL